MPSQAPPIAFVRCDDEQVNRNFTNMQKWMGDLSVVIRGQITPDTLLATGNNFITPPLKNVRGRIVVYQSEPADISDGGLQSDGRWLMVASAPTTVRLLFF